MKTRHNNLDWMDFMAITVVVIICIIAILSGGCYRDVPVVVSQVRWHNAPVTCLTLPAPTKPKDVYCFSDFASLPSSSYEECETIQAAQWAEYGKNAFIWIHNYVEPMCYEAVGRAGGPQ